jgi:hypothetical protein
MATVEVSHLLTAILLSLVFALDLFPCLRGQVCILQMPETSGADSRTANFKADLRRPKAIL